MKELMNESGGAGPSHRSVEVGVAVAMAVLALIGIYGSLKVGIGWGAEGPRAGFFPFYISLFIIISCIVNTVQAVRSGATGQVFASWGQLRKVMTVVIPTAIYVAVIPYIGIYLASALLIAGFMMVLGRYHVAVAVPVGVGVPIATFLMFEIWFLVPLPKGPIEKFLGF